ncbi:MAG: hypothetical protein ACOC56_04125 [Atribacterota bacterium]
MKNLNNLTPEQINQKERRACKHKLHCFYELRKHKNDKLMQTYERRMEKINQDINRYNELYYRKRWER